MKLSGEQLSGKFDSGIDSEFGAWLAAEIKKVVNKGIQVVIMVGGGANSTAYRQVLAELCDLPIVVANADQAVAAGACVQAAAVLQQQAPADVAARWGFGGGTEVATHDPRSHSTDRVQSVRAAYSALRDRTA